jgi:hypothetical protein
MIRCGRKQAIIAIAHKLLKTMFLSFQRGDYCRDAIMDYKGLTIQRKCAVLD